MSNKSTFLYKTSFTNQIFASEKIGDDKSLKVSRASLKNLQSLFPANINKDVGLLYTFFNGAVANRFNANDDGIDGKTAIAVAKYFIDKPTNLDHKTKDIVGHVISYGFSSFDADNRILYENELNDFNGPFNMSFGGVIYKNVDPYFAAMVSDSSNEESENFNKISTSWEIGFNDFKIAVGKSRNVNECRIISDPVEMTRYIPYLRAFGGSGKTIDGEFVMRLIVGDVFPLGFGYTMNPAADVIGVSVLDLDCEESDNTETEDEDKEKYSHDLESNVNQKETKINDMDINEILKKVIDESKKAKTFSDESAASLAKIISDEISAKSEEYSKTLAKEAEAKAEIEKNNAELETKIKELSKKVEDTEAALKSAASELESLKRAESARNTQELFNGRMEEINSIYDFDNDEKSFVAKEISAIASSEEDFNKYKERAAIIYKRQGKAFKEEEQKRIDKIIQEKVNEQLKKEEISTVSSIAAVPDSTVKIVDEVNITEALASLSPKNDTIPNSMETEQGSTFDKYMKSLLTTKKITASIN